jgi:hypothetical protein
VTETHAVTLTQHGSLAQGIRAKKLVGGWYTMCAITMEDQVGGGWYHNHMMLFVPQMAFLFSDFMCVSQLKCWGRTQEGGE